jgi:hypothetical protein
LTYWPAPSDAETVQENDSSWPGAAEREPAADDVGHPVSIDPKLSFATDRFREAKPARALGNGFDHGGVMDG